MFLVEWPSLVSSYAGSHKTGSPQASIDIDVNRLVLLDRLDNGDSDDTQDDEIAF